MNVEIPEKRLSLGDLELAGLARRQRLGLSGSGRGGPGIRGGLDSARDPPHESENEDRQKQPQNRVTPSHVFLPGVHLLLGG